jgi:hypothetical protein
MVAQPPLRRVPPEPPGEPRWQDAGDSLLQGHIGRGVVPYTLKVCADHQQYCGVEDRGRRNLRIELGTPALDLCHVSQRAVPAALELRRDEALRGVHRLVAPCREGGVVSCLFELQVDRTSRRGVVLRSR